MSNYRCLKSIELDLDDYTSLIGTNGTGKSSVLYALDWFFNGGELSDADLHAGAEALEPESQGKAGIDPNHEVAPRIEVEVTFDQVNAADREVLGRYARGETVWLRRSWPVGGKQKMIGNSMQGPGFAEVRAATPRVTEMRPLYKELRKTLEALPDVTARDDILSALAAWEDAPENREKLVNLADDDATHLFGFAGEDVLARRFRLILVRAGVDIAASVGTAGKGSVLSQLLGALTTEAVSSARRDWETKYQDQLDELETAIRQRVGDVTASHASAVNRHFSDLVSTGEVRFVGEPPEWALRGEATVRADVTVNGVQTDVARQGHGVQRALMMAVLQAMARPDEAEAQSIEPQELPNIDDAPRRSAPALLLCLEEPEIYQHPVRARHFARVLDRLARSDGSQVLLATHSPYFVLPRQFASLRRFSAHRGAARVASTSVNEIAIDCGEIAGRIVRCVEKEVPRTFSEGFFAEAVVLVEGDTDRVIVEAIADRLDMPLDAHGIAVLAVHSKENLRIPAEILKGIGVAVYVLADGDALGAARKHPDEAAAAVVEGSHRTATERLLKWLPHDVEAKLGQSPAVFGGSTTVTSQWTLLRDDLEQELTTWPGFVAELTAMGCDLRDRNVAAYRSAALASPLQGAPESLLELIKAIIEFAGRAVPEGD